MIGEILGALNILEKAGRAIDWIRKARKFPTESVGSRFIRLFESHDIHRNQIPRFFGHGLTVKDVQDESLLLDKLGESLLDAACNLFGVRREWLEGAESQVYPCHDFYKHPERVVPFLKPEEFLSGVDPGQDNFGLISALELWLRLEENGFMDTGLSMYPKASIRSSFEQALHKL